MTSPGGRGPGERAGPGLFPVAVFLVIGVAGCGSGGSGSERPAPPTRAGAGAPTAMIKVVARDAVLEPNVAAVAAGLIAVSYVNEGELQHTLLVAGQEKRLALMVAKKGDTDTGSIELFPGEYILYCDIPGHRSAGMEAKLTVR